MVILADLVTLISSALSLEMVVGIRMVGLSSWVIGAISIECVARRAPVKDIAEIGPNDTLAVMLTIAVCDVYVGGFGRVSDLLPFC